MATASLIFFYFGEDSYLTRIAQETMPLHLAMEGYDRTVLLHHETQVGPFTLSQEAICEVTVRDIPTKENLVRQLNDLRRSGHTTDVFLFTHGGQENIRVSKGAYGDNGVCFTTYIEEHVPEPLKLRAVWGVNCFGASWNPLWRRLGARIAGGPRYVNFYPTRFRGFIKAWNDGQTYGEALKASDTDLSRLPAQSYILLDALEHLHEWNGNVLEAATVLGDNKASKRYFNRCWPSIDLPVMEDMSGKERMKFSSHVVTSGDRTVTR